MKKAHNRIEMVGKTYNSWKVLEHSHTNGKIPYYKCECAECSNIHVVDGRNVRNGMSKRCRDCGFKVGALGNTGKKHNQSTPKEIAERYLIIDKRKSAVSRGINWGLSMEEFVSLIYKNCEYCGIEPKTTVNPTKNRSLHADRAKECFITYNGIDRVHSSQGYEIGNVVTCCPQCNKAKLDSSVNEFKAWIQRAATHLNLK